MEMWNVKEAIDTAFACVILHNILLAHGLYGAEFDPLLEPSEVAMPHDNDLDDLDEAETGVNAIRNALAVYLSTLSDQ